MDRKRKERVIPDDNIPEMTAADFRRARLMREDMPEVVEAFKHGPGWQKRIADTLARSASRTKSKRRASGR